MENKRLRYSMQILEVVMNFLVIFCLETVVFSSFSNLEGLVGETGALVKAPGILRQLLFWQYPCFFCSYGKRRGIS